MYVSDNEQFPVGGANFQFAAIAGGVDKLTRQKSLACLEADFEVWHIWMTTGSQIKCLFKDINHHRTDFAE